MKHIICFSGGKDSTALLLWALDNLPEFDTVFCDTGWEHEITYAYIDKIDRELLGGKLIRLNDEWGGMRGLVEKKGRVPSAKARFCTEKLKVLPMIKWLDGIEEEKTVYQGIRAQESQARSNMKPRMWSDDYDAWIERPLFHWTHEQIFDLLKAKNVEPNPLYLLGARRVGCFPCVLISHRDLKALLQSTPEVRDRIVELEQISGRTFFPPNYIPQHAMKSRDPKTGKKIAFAEDVFKYLTEASDDQIPLLPIVQCMSAYNLCE